MSMPIAQYKYLYAPSDIYKYKVSVDQLSYFGCEFGAFDTFYFCRWGSQWANGMPDHCMVHVDINSDDLVVDKSITTVDSDEFKCTYSGTARCMNQIIFKKYRKVNNISDAQLVFLNHSLTYIAEEIESKDGLSVLNTYTNDDNSSSMGVKLASGDIIYSTDNNAGYYNDLIKQAKKFSKDVLQNNYIIITQPGWNDSGPIVYTLDDIYKEGSQDKINYAAIVHDYKKQIIDYYKDETNPYSITNYQEDYNREDLFKETDFDAFRKDINQSLDYDPFAEKNDTTNENQVFKPEYSSDNNQRHYLLDEWCWGNYCDNYTPPKKQKFVFYVKCSLDLLALFSTKAIFRLKIVANSSYKAILKFSDGLSKTFDTLDTETTVTIVKNQINKTLLKANILITSKENYATKIFNFSFDLSKIKTLGQVINPVADFTEDDFVLNYTEPDYIIIDYSFLSGYSMVYNDYLVNLKTGIKVRIEDNSLFNYRFEQKYKRVIIDYQNNTPAKSILVGNFNFIENLDENYLYQYSIEYQFDNKLFNFYDMDTIYITDVNNQNNVIEVYPLNDDVSDIKSSYFPDNYEIIDDLGSAVVSSLFFNKINNKYVITVNNFKLLVIDIENQEFLFLPDYTPLALDYYQNNEFYSIYEVGNSQPFIYLNKFSLTYNNEVNEISNNVLFNLDSIYPPAEDYKILLSVKYKKIVVVAIDVEDLGNNSFNIYKDIHIIVYDLDTANKIDEFTIDLAEDSYTTDYVFQSYLDAVFVNSNIILVSFVSYKYNSSEILGINIDEKKIIHKYFIPIDNDMNYYDAYDNRIVSIKGRFFAFTKYEGDNDEGEDDDAE